MAKERTLFACTACGYETSRWVGRCPGCGAWNTMVESAPIVTGAPAKAPKQRPGTGASAMLLREIPEDVAVRSSTGISELDRVLGGGIVEGALMLIGGDPGIGKSTLLLQVCANLCKTGKRVLYVSGEESAKQLKLRANRLGITSETLYVLAENALDNVEEKLRGLSPDVAVIDSIQTMYRPDMASAPGSVSQIRECTSQIMRLCKESGTAIFLVGHVTKDGAIAGPRMLEHMVDVVLYFEGDRHMTYRILRAAKNRIMEERRMRTLFTSESVTEGHPDKIADQISDAVLDAILAKEIELQEQGYIAPNGVPANVENVRCACETLVTTGTVIVAGEIRTQAYVDVQEIARGVIRRIGYNRAKFGFDCDTCGVMSLIHEQSPDIAQGVDESFETQTGATTDPIDLIGAGDQGMMFGYACNETKTLMPMPHYLASRLAERLSAVRHDGTLPYLRPDGKTQVTVRYEDGKRKQAITRGAEGRIGEDVTHTVRTFMNVPMCIPCTDKFEVRGEGVISWAHFEKINLSLSEPYSHPRNLAAGSVRMLDARESGKRYREFYAFDLISDSIEEQSKTAQLQFLAENGFDVVPYVYTDTHDADELRELITDFKPA